jgi:hypothetical protein
MFRHDNTSECGLERSFIGLNDLIGHRPLLRRVRPSGWKTIAEKGMGIIRFPIGPAFDHCQLSFRQSSFVHTTRVLPPSTSIVCQVLMAFLTCYFPLCLLARGR